MIEKLKIEYIPISEIIPYENNPRKNAHAVEIVKKSIREFGFKVPIILDRENKIIAGHTRLLAAKELEMQEVPVIWADDLTDSQVKALRIMENKSHEFANWDFNILKLELEELKKVNFDLNLTGFNFGEIENLSKVNSHDDEWVGMPEFQKGDESYKIIVHFENESERDEFDRIYKLKYRTKQNKAWTAWWPYKERDDLNSVKFSKDD